MTHVYSDIVLRSYLLGALEADQSDSIEATYFSDGSLFRRLELIEAELIDAYAADSLSKAERAAVEARLLTSQEGRRRVGFARALMASLAEPGPRGASKRPSGHRSSLATWFETLRRLLQGRHLYWAPVAFAVLLLGVYLGSANLKGEDPMGAAVLRLHGGQLRAGAAVPQAPLPDGDLAVELGLDAEEAALEFVVRLERGGERIWESSSTRRDPQAPLKVQIPGRLLAPGRYQLELAAGQADAPPLAYYAFRIMP